MAQGFEEVVVGKLQVVQGGGGSGVPEKAPQGGQRQVAAGVGELGVAGQRPDEEAELTPEVAVPGALDPAGEAAEPGSSVV